MKLPHHAVLSMSMKCEMFRRVLSICYLFQVMITSYKGIYIRRSTKGDAVT